MLVPRVRSTCTWEEWIDTINNGQKKFSESSDGPLSYVAAMDIDRDELIFGVSGVFNDLFLCSACFVVE